MTARAAFLDLDGVLIDSMSAHAKAWVMMLHEQGIVENELLFYLREGEKAEDTAALVIEKHGRVTTPSERLAMVERKRELYRRMAPSGLRADAKAMVNELNARSMPCIIVTGSNRRNVDKTVSADEQKLFARIITADDYEHGKPAPDPYLSAWKFSGLTKEECRVLENAPLGITSAKAAGIMTIAITTTLSPAYLSEADHIIHSYSEFLNYL